METLKHRHHIIPKYMGGSNDPTNLVEVTITQHAMFHYCNWRLWSNEEDKLAWRGLSGIISHEQCVLDSLKLGGHRGGTRSKDLGVGIHSRTKEEMVEHGKKILELGLGMFSMSEDDKRNARKSGIETQKKLGVGIFALTPEERSNHSRKIGNKHKENKTGICGRTKEQMSEDGKKGGNKLKKLGLGIHSLTKEQLSEIGKKSGEQHKKNGTGIFALTPEQRTENAKKAGNKTKELGLGIFSRSKEEMSEHGRKSTNQRWQCIETGYITNAGALTNYQRKRGIDTSKRKRIS